MSAEPIYRDTCGKSPLIPPDVLRLLLNKLGVVRLRLKSRATGKPSWECIDSLSRAMEAARK